MSITEQQAIEYLTGLAIAMREKINIFDCNNSNSLRVTEDERIMCGCLELVLIKAKANVLFSSEIKSEEI